MSETAAQRALGIYEVVDAIISHCHAGIVVEKTHKLNMLRGVNKLFKRIYDENLVMSLITSEGLFSICNVSMTILRILAAGPVMLSRVTALKIHGFKLSSERGALVQKIFGSYAQTICKLDIESAGLVLCSEHLTKNPTLLLPRLDTLHLDLCQIDINRYMAAFDIVKKASAFLHTLSTLELSEKARIVFDAYDGNRLGGFELAHSIPEWQITVMLSIRPVNIKELKLVSEADYTPHPLQLARIYNHFSETEHLLVESLESPIFLEGLLSTPNYPTHSPFG